MFRRTLIVTISSLLITACASGPRRGKNIDYPHELEQVFLLVSQGESELSLKQIQSYLDRSEKLQWHGHAYYLQGRVHQGQKNWDKAIGSFRKAIRQSSGFDSVVEAQSLYRLSQVYENTGQINELVASLLDLMKRRPLFGQLVAEVEIPARLSAAYAGQSQIQKANIFHQQARQALQKIINRHGSSLSGDDISKSRYYLGAAIYPTQHENFDSLLQKLKLGQRFLLAASENQSSEWGERSQKALLQAYQKLWDLLVEHPASPQLSHDRDAQTKQKQHEQLEMASDFYDLALRLQDERNPKIQPDSYAAEVLLEGRNWIERLERFASQLSLGPEVTRKKRIKNRPLLNKMTPVVPAAPTSFKEGASPSQSQEPSPQLPPKDAPESSVEIGEDPNL